ncbi:MAG: hypothetical protein GY839_14030, partial [candidate division Zixibacteria bacterium]|nr:hypothetical protein [candidate division Zixibacteria bacterium]
MRKVLCVTIFVLISASFAIGQDDDTYDFYLIGGLSNISIEPSFVYNSLDPFHNFNSSGFGAKSLGMGGIYYATDNDGYGSFLNPATMIHTSKSMMSLSLVSSSDKHRQSFKYMTPEFYDPDHGWNFDYSQSDINGKHNRFNQVGAVAPFTYFDRDWWFGGGFRTVFDLHNEVVTPLYLEGAQTAFTQHRGVDAINMAIATNPMPNIGLGINFNIYTRGYEMDYWLPNYSVDEFGDTLAEAVHLRDKSTFTGSNFDFGINADFDMIKLGFVVSTALSLTQKTIHLRGDINPYGETVGLIDRFTVNNKFPMTFGGGAVFAPMENIELGVDVTYKPFSKVRMDIDPEQDIWIDISDYDPEWEDLLQIRAGAEYVYDAGFAKIPLRAGIQNLPSLKKGDTRFVNYNTAYLDSMNADSVVIADSTFTGDQFNTYLFSVGTGLKFEKIWFDLAYQFGSSEYDFILVSRGDNTGLEFLSEDPIKFK